MPDDDPLDQCNGHGTHVGVRTTYHIHTSICVLCPTSRALLTHTPACHSQGIIGADPNNPFNISGVASQASINAYRVFGCTGSVTDDGERGCFTGRLPDWCRNA